MSIKNGSTRTGYSPRNLAHGAEKAFADYLVPGQRLMEAADLVIRVCTQQNVVPPALALYHSQATHYHSSEEGICAVYLSSRALHSERYPTQLYHELAHHIHGIHDRGAGEHSEVHNIEFTRHLLKVIDGDNFKLDYNWFCEYVGVARLAAKCGYLPRDFTAKEKGRRGLKWATLREYNERHIDPVP